MENRKIGIEFHISEHCNLKCAGCDHFSPLADPEFANYEETEKDLLRLRDLFGKDGIERIHILGGEPLLNPQVKSFLSMTRSIFPICRIELVTNGILLLRQGKDFWETCRSCDIIIRPTKYPINIDFAEIEKKATKEGVKFRYFNEGQVVKTLYRLKLNTEGRCDGNCSFTACDMANKCWMLKHGKLFTCPVIPNIHHLNKYFKTEFLISAEDYVDIYKNVSKAEIIKKLGSTTDFCRYCDIESKQYNIEWTRTEYSLNEWGIE